ncbi:hypothetical protein K3N28_09385 [Glycomyces sp. TRM65418]|uniref:hypothetical protein n=1 Tax=Glycomyces sp. TRM65418 TaxID=2867006 RepID=UPI001CE4C75D|nr:hypothetical protein [Glycomyces sp. TRM65418]MCC3763283.1 hypothetical protein [Glycomyces sp. TRM65418]QZD57283.1 hypothetical protein K3N28_09325 [Glycomyces sp. TRM65418]
MPRLLPADALHGPPTRARWTAVLAAALALTAWNTDWTALGDTARGLLPGTSEQYDWDTAELEAAPDVDNAATAAEGLHDITDIESAMLAVDDMILLLVWDASVSIPHVRVEAYTDAYGSGLRLGIATDTTTAPGTGCVSAVLTTPEHHPSTSLQTCTRTDQHRAPDHSAVAEDAWRPDHLFLTQTANVDPPDRARPTLIDYYGLGHDTGNAYESALWGPNITEPYLGATEPGCDNAAVNLMLDDSHLDTGYPAVGLTREVPEPVASPAWAEPTPGRLRTLACTPISQHRHGNGHLITAEPFEQHAPAALTGWAQYNAATRDPQPIRTAVAVDLRSCDTDLDHCTTDTHTDPHYLKNNGTAGEWMSELLDPDR